MKTALRWFIVASVLFIMALCIRTGLRPTLFTKANLLQAGLFTLIPLGVVIVMNRIKHQDKS